MGWCPFKSHSGIHGLDSGWTMVQRYLSGVSPNLGHVPRVNGMEPVSDNETPCNGPWMWASVHVPRCGVLYQPTSMTYYIIAILAGHPRIGCPARLRGHKGCVDSPLPSPPSHPRAPLRFTYESLTGAFLTTPRAERAPVIGWQE